MLSLTACDTLATRRSAYRQNKASGPYTRQLKEGVRPSEQTSKPQATPAPKPEEPAPLPQAS